MYTDIVERRRMEKRNRVRGFLFVLVRYAMHVATIIPGLFSQLYRTLAISICLLSCIMYTQLTSAEWSSWLTDATASGILLNHGVINPTLAYISFDPASSVSQLENRVPTNGIERIASGLFAFCYICVLYIDT